MGVFLFSAFAYLMGMYMGSVKPHDVSSDYTKSIEGKCEITSYRVSYATIIGVTCADGSYRPLKFRK